VEEGCKINKLDYIDHDNDLVGLISDFTDRWFDLNRDFDDWYTEVTEKHKMFQQLKNTISSFTSTLVYVDRDNPLPAMFDPSRLRSQVEEVEVFVCCNIVFCSTSFTIIM